MEGTDTSQVVSVDRLTYTYAAATNPAVTDLSFSINRGEIFGLLGPSGAGKSTTQKVLIGLLPDYGGGVSVFGKDLARWSAEYYESLLPSGAVTRGHRIGVRALGRQIRPIQSGVLLRKGETLGSAVNQFLDFLRRDARA